jgi:hypothetical protein
VIVLVAGLLLWSVVGVQAAKRAQNATSSDDLIENLEYQSVLPEGKTSRELGGWKRVSPPDGDPVYAYTDTIDSVRISVSQQPLPEKMKTNTDEAIASLAKQFNATTKISSSTTPYYIGNSAKGPQSVILTKNALLILIKSESAITEASWTAYVQKLN